LKANSINNNGLMSSIKLLTGRQIKKYFGKGPDKITVTLENRKIILELHGLLNKAELKAMALDGAKRTIKQYRQFLMEALFREVDPLQKELGLPVIGVSIDFLPGEDKCYIIFDLAGEMKNLLMLE